MQFSGQCSARLARREQAWLPGTRIGVTGIDDQRADGQRLLGVMGKMLDTNLHRCGTKSVLREYPRDTRARVEQEHR